MQQYIYVKEMLNDGKAGKVIHMIDISNENAYRAIASIEAFCSRWLNVWFNGERRDQCRYGSTSDWDISRDIESIDRIKVYCPDFAYPEVLCYESVEEFFNAIKYDKTKSSQRCITFTNGVKYTFSNNNQKGNM